MATSWVPTAKIFCKLFLARYSSRGTKETYKIALEQYLKWCLKAKVDPLQARSWDIERYLQTLERKGLKATSVNHKLGVLRAFYRFTVQEDLILKNPTLGVRSRPRVFESTSTSLSRGQLFDVLKVAEEQGPQEHALICLLGLNGLRISEVLGIKVDDLRMDRGQYLAHIRRKGGKTQWVPAAPRTSWALKLLHDLRSSGPLFLNCYGNQMTPVNARTLITKLTKEAKIPQQVTPHSFRHTFVTLSLDAGVSERDVIDLNWTHNSKDDCLLRSS